jgi:hypothetical protein
MTTARRIGAKQDERLISELPLREGLAIYLDAWKQLISTAFKSLVVAGLALLVVAIASMFLTAATVISVTSLVVTFFMSLIVDHPFLTLLALVGFVLGLLALRGRRSESTR